MLNSAFEHLDIGDEVIFSEEAEDKGPRATTIRLAGNQFVARIIRESGNGTLLFDLLTAEGEIEDNLTRSPRFNIGLLASRLAEVTLWLVAQPAARDLGIGYFGSSTGGGAALVAAAEVGQRIDAVVSRGGRLDLAGDALPRAVADAAHRGWIR